MRLKCDLEGFASFLAPAPVQDVRDVAKAAATSLRKKAFCGGFSYGIRVGSDDGEIPLPFGYRRIIPRVNKHNGNVKGEQSGESLMGAYGMLRLCVDNAVDVPCGKSFNVMNKAFRDTSFDAQIPLDSSRAKITQQTFDVPLPCGIGQVDGNDDSLVSLQFHDG